MGIVLAVGLAVGWAYHAANRRGAAEWQAAVAELRAAGLEPRYVPKPDAMPPPERNGAAQGIIKEWEEAFKKPLDRSLPLPPAQASLAELDGEPMRDAWHKKSKQPEVADFSRLRRGGHYGQSAASFLAEYERRNGTTLQRLAECLAMPEVRRSPWMGKGWPRARLESVSSRAADGLALRAEAALQTGDPGKAAESLWMLSRLSEAIATREAGRSMGMSARALGRIATPLRTGIRGHLWRAEDLEKIAGELRRVDVRGALRIGVEMRLNILPEWADGRDHRQRAGTPGTLDDFRPYTSEFLRMGGGYFLADGWFDSNAAAQARGILECYKAAIDPGPVRHWCVTGRRQDEDFMAVEGLQAFEKAAYPVAAHNLISATRALVLRDLLLTACELERYYGEHRTYPAALKDLPAGTGVGIDPLDGGSFVYKVETGGSFTLYSKGPDGKDDGNGSGDWGW